MCSFVNLLALGLTSFWLFGDVVVGEIPASLKQLRYEASNGSLQIPVDTIPDDSHLPDHYYILSCNYQNYSVSVYDAWSYGNSSLSAIHKGSESMEDEDIGNLTTRKLQLFMEDGVFATDQRELVPDTTIYPWQSVGLIRMYTSSGYFGSCTGTLIAPSVVLTAASCIYNLLDNDFFESITFSPGETYLDEPFGVYTADEVTVKTAYALGSQSYDFGLILLDGRPPVKRMSFGYDCLDSKMTLNIAGYPYDRSLLALVLDMYFTVCEESIDMCPIGGGVKNLYHFCDAALGMEGAPMWEYNTLTKSRTIRAVHYGGDFLSNNAAIITPFVYEYITDKLQEWGQL